MFYEDNKNGILGKPHTHTHADHRGKPSFYPHNFNMMMTFIKHTPEKKRHNNTKNKKKKKKTKKTCLNAS